MTKQQFSGPGILRIYPDCAPSAFTNIDQDEYSPFLGLFEGKAKAAKAQSTDDSSSGSGSSGKATFAEILAGILGVAGSIAPILPAIGIGSRARKSEMSAQANADVTVINAQAIADKAQAIADAKAQQSKIFIVVIGGAFLVFMVIALVASKK